MNNFYFYIALIILVIIGGTIWLMKKEKNTVFVVTFILSSVIAVLGLFATTSLSIQSSVTDADQGNIAGNEVAFETSVLSSNDITLSQADSNIVSPSTQFDNWIRVREIHIESISEYTNIITCAVTVEYNYEGDGSRAIIALHGNYVEVESWASFGLDSEDVIEIGYGRHTFTVDVVVPEWNDFSFIGYIHPFIRTDEWLPIAISNPVEIDVKKIYEQHSAP